MSLPRCPRKPRHLLRRLVAVAALFVLGPRAALAQPAADAGTPATPAAAPADSWAGQLDALGRWLEQHRGAGARCVERCYTLDRLRLTGRVGEGPLKFELTGGVLAEGPVAVPLFGSPTHVRLEGATEDGRDAVVGFEGDHYFLFTAARRFSLKGTLTLDGDLALTIPGPLNTLEADVTAGAVVEGSRLSGLSGATLHLSREGAAQGSGPTVFQLSRAVRVGREIGFEYRLVMRSGTDLGVVRLPLPFGEKVLDATGAAGWRVEGAELVLPTSGRIAEMTITGTLGRVGSFAPDARSGYEWWLLESDPEHRVSVAGDAHQLDSAESPIPRTQASSRLFLVQKGQHIEVAVQPLVSVDVLAAVVRDHQRTIVLTQRGDLVSDDNLTYENNGIDYLLYAPDGRPIYLATDGKAERIMHQGKEGNDVLVPLRTGSHSVRVQALAEAPIKAFGGQLDLPMPSYPLTASRMSLSLGVPARVFPVALLGGDRAEWFLDAGDLAAVVLGFVVAWFAVRVDPAAPKGRARRLRLLGGGVLAGLWFLSGAAFAAAIFALATAALIWLFGRLAGGAKLLAGLLLLGGALLFVLVALSAVSMRSASRSEWPSDVSPPSSPAASPSLAGDRSGKLGNYAGPSIPGGVLEGVTPVALTLPSHVRQMVASRELVTRDRPFQPTLLYVTDWTLWPLALLWFAGAALLLRAHRGPVEDARAWLRVRFQRPPAPPAEGELPPPVAP